MGKCSNCGGYAHNIRTCPGFIRKNNTVLKSLCKTKKSCITCNKKGHTFESCEELEKIISGYLYSEAPSPIYPRTSTEDVWIDIM